jgi:hypothetical protein
VDRDGQGFVVQGFVVQGFVVQGVVTQDRHFSATKSPDESLTHVEPGRRRMRTSNSSDA